MPMPDEDEYQRTEENQPSRHAERARYDRETVHAVLDGGLLAHVGFVVDDRPAVLPMLYVRVGESVYLHGSTGSHLARMAMRRGSLPVAVEVTLVDELVMARATFSHSANYRSVVVHGDAAPVAEAGRKEAVMAALVERIVPGRAADARAPREDELRQTAVLEVPLDNVSAKVRAGDPIDDAGDLDRPCWAGVLPLQLSWGEPRPSGDLGAGIAVPAYLGAGTPLAPA